MMPAYGFPQAISAQAVGGPRPNYQYLPPQRLADPRVPRQPSSWTAAPGQSAAAGLPRPIYRAQIPDEPAAAPRAAAPIARPAPLTIPTPEALGLTVAKPALAAEVDWSGVHKRLSRLGATCFHLERQPDGNCRITCLLPTDQPGRSRRIEAGSANEEDAVRVLLAKVEEWAQSR